MADHITTILLAVLGSSVVSTIIVAIAGRQREKSETDLISAETKQTDRETDSISAEAYTLWMQSNISLQKQRQEDIDYYTARIAEMEASQAIKTKAAQDACEAKIKKLNARVEVLERERADVLVENRQKDKRITELQKEIAQLKKDVNGG